MASNLDAKHVAHCILFCIVIVAFLYIAKGRTKESGEYASYFNPIKIYGICGCVVLYALRLIPLLTLPQCIFHFLGLVCYNAFPKDVPLKVPLKCAPFLCMRVVTRGNYPTLVKQNLQRNLDLCHKMGLVNFVFEVVSDKPINLQKDRFVREIAVPSSYSTKTGALYKGRALQYCLEDDVNVLNDDDWIVHLDEETIVTESALKGIINFVADGKHQFGQGLITYSNERIVNWLTTMADSSRVADDMGKLRFQFKMFHRPLFAWKGSFMICQVGPERKLSFDHGTEGSISEDAYFSMVAFSRGYSFDFVEGEMWEKSPFTIGDYLRQRKRWIEGGLQVAHSSAIPLKYRILWIFTSYSRLTFPLSLLSVPLELIFPTPSFLLLDIATAFVVAVGCYMYLYGAMKSLNWSRLGARRWIFGVLGTVFVMPLTVPLDAISAAWCCLGHSNAFYIVEKSIS